MRVRLAFESDLDAVVEMARMNIEETRPELGFDEDRCVETFYRYMDTANPTIWVVEGQSGVVGFLLATVSDYLASAGQNAAQAVLFVKPANRGSRAAVLLMKELISWSEMLGIRELSGGNDNSFNSERTAKFLEHFGFEKVGYAMRRVVSDGR